MFWNVSICLGFITVYYTFNHIFLPGDHIVYLTSLQDEKLARTYQMNEWNLYVEKDTDSVLSDEDRVSDDETRKIKKQCSKIADENIRKEQIKLEELESRLNCYREHAADYLKTQGEPYDEARIDELARARLGIKNIKTSKFR